jgi:hypothetical protein
MFKIVACVDDYRQILGGHYRRQPVNQLCAPYPACQRDYLHK